MELLYFNYFGVIIDAENYGIFNLK